MLICYTTENWNKTETTEADILKSIKNLGYEIVDLFSRYKVYEKSINIARCCLLTDGTLLCIYAGYTTLIFIHLPEDGNNGHIYIKAPNKTTLMKFFTLCLDDISLLPYPCNNYVPGILTNLFPETTTNTLTTLAERK